MVVIKRDDDLSRKIHITTIDLNMNNHLKIQLKATHSHVYSVTTIWQQAVPQVYVINAVAITLLDQHCWWRLHRLFLPDVVIRTAPFLTTKTHTRRDRSWRY